MAPTHVKLRRSVLPMNLLTSIYPNAQVKHRDLEAAEVWILSVSSQSLCLVVEYDSGDKNANRDIEVISP
jgi:hypothetical protein